MTAADADAHVDLFHASAHLPRSLVVGGFVIDLRVGGAVTGLGTPAASNHGHAAASRGRGHGDGGVGDGAASSVGRGKTGAGTLTHVDPPFEGRMGMKNVDERGSAASGSGSGGASAIFDHFRFHQSVQQMPTFQLLPSGQTPALRRARRSGVGLRVLTSSSFAGGPGGVVVVKPRCSPVSGRRDGAVIGSSCPDGWRTLRGARAHIHLDGATEGVEADVPEVDSALAATVVVPLLVVRVVVPPVVEGG